jgi:hypothetical protein
MEVYMAAKPDVELSGVSLSSLEKQWCREALKTLRAVIARKLTSEKNIDVRALREKELLEVDGVSVKFL